MRVALDVGEGVVLAVHGHPLPRPDPGGDPHQEPEHLVDRRVAASAPGGTAPGAGRRWWRRWRGATPRSRRPRRRGSSAASSARVAATTYWSVGRRPSSVWRMARRRPRRTHATPARRSARPGRRSSTRPSTCFADDRLRGHVAQRHRRRRRHPPAQPAAPLPVQGGAVRRGLRAPAVGLVRPPRRRRVLRRAPAGPRSSSSCGPGSRYFADNPAYVRLVRREAIDGGTPPRHRPGRRAAPDVRPRRRLLPPGDGRRHVPPAGPRAAPDHGLRRPAQLLLRRPVPRRPARRRPARPATPSTSASTTCWRSSTPPSCPTRLTRADAACEPVPRARGDRPPARGGEPDRVCRGTPCSAHACDAIDRVRRSMSAVIVGV